MLDHDRASPLTLHRTSVMRKLSTVRDLVTLFQKHENTIYRWITVDRLFPNAFRVKDGWYVPEPDVQRLIRNGRARAVEQQTD